MTVLLSTMTLYIILQENQVENCSFATNSCKNNKLQLDLTKIKNRKFDIVNYCLQNKKRKNGAVIDTTPFYR